MNMRSVLLVSVIALALPGCAWISYDASQAPVARDLMEGCHATTIETALFHYNPDKSKNRPNGATYLIQSGFPTNEWTVTDYADDWDEILTLPPGTEFRVTRVYDQAWGKQGRYWLLYARLENSDLFDREFIVPSGNFTETGQIWVRPVSPDENGTPLRLQENFVTVCPE